MEMKITVLCALLCVALHAASTAQAAPSPDDKVDCSKLEEVLDELGSAQSITLLNDKYKPSTNAEEHSKRCTEMTDAIKTLRKYNKECYSSLTQQVLSAVLRTRSQFTEAHCKDSSSAEFKEALASVKCVGEQTAESVREAEKKTIVSFQVLSEAAISDDKLRVKRACCAVLESKKLFMGAIKDKCSAHEKIYSDYVDSYTSEAMGLICPEADKLECDKLEALKTDGVTHKTKFFLTPLMKVIKQMDH